MGVAFGGRVDEAKKAFFVRRFSIVAAILRANIDGSLGWDFTAFENRVELGRIVARKKHIVAQQRKAFATRHGCPCNGR